jgi:prephenate dehydrogenase
VNTVVIVGVGLIGGSFALALRKAGFTDASSASVPRHHRKA